MREYFSMCDHSSRIESQRSHKPRARTAQVGLKNIEVANSSVDRVRRAITSSYGQQEMLIGIAKKSLSGVDGHPGHLCDRKGSVTHSNFNKVEQR
jgi:hypothetical protein